MISPIKRLTVAAPASELDALCTEILHLRAVQVVREEADGLTPGGDRVALQAAEKTLADVESAIAVLAPYGKGRRKVFEVLDRAGYEKLALLEENALAVTDKVKRVVKELDDLQTKRNDCAAMIAACAPFLSYAEPLSFTGTAHTALVKGSLPKLCDAEALKKEAEDAGIEVVDLGPAGEYRYVYAVCHRADEAAMLRLLASYGFTSLPFTGLDGTAAEETDRLKAEKERLDKQYDDVKADLPVLAKELPTLEKVRDYLAGKAERERLKDTLEATESTGILSGWVPEKAVDRLKKVLDGLPCAYSLREPTDDEKPPVYLVNNRFATPFEAVLGLYSYPDYRGIDPTAVMSVFYFIIFGLIMQDVGYGLLLMIGCPLLRKLRHPPKGGMMDKMLSMFTYCGVSSVVCGVLFGGYFGDLPAAVAKMFGVTDFPDLAVLLNPVTQPIPYLALSLALGALHLIAGMLMKAVLLIRRGKVIDAVCDVFIWLVVFAGLGLLFLVPDVGKWVLIAGLLGLILTQGRAEKNPVMKLLKGIMSLYDLVGYASDLLSYSRIMALGLSGVIIGQVVNNIGTLGGPTLVGFIVLLLAFALGHALNFALSLLGAFVHTARLQYIEFLGKFYEDGGEEFKAAGIKTKYTEITYSH